MTRISQNQIVSTVLNGIFQNRGRVAKFSEEITTGLKVSDPGDSDQSGMISQFRQTVQRVGGYKSVINIAKSYLGRQDDILIDADEIMVRAKEIASQGVNTTNSEDTRRHMAAEVFQLRDHFVQLANSTYQGRYLWGGTDDDDPPYDPSTYTNPSTGPESIRYVYDADAGSSDQRTLNITDDMTITVNTSGNNVFSNGIYALERLGRALQGYETNPATGAPNNTGNAYVFPTDFNRQTDAIKDTIDLLDTARQDDILDERVSLGGRMRRLETAESILELSQVNADELLDKLQNADVVASASNLSQAQTALQASFSVSSRVLNLSILDYI